MQGRESKVRVAQGDMVCVIYKSSREPRGASGNLNWLIL